MTRRRSYVAVVRLIGQLSMVYPLSDAELAEAETVLEQLLRLVQSLR